MTTVLVILACIGAVAGLYLLSQATLGIGVLAVACLLAVLARIAQSATQHDDIRRVLVQRAGPGPLDGEPDQPGKWQCPQCGYWNGEHVFDCTRCRARRPAE